MRGNNRSRITPVSTSQGMTMPQDYSDPVAKLLTYGAHDIELQESGTVVRSRDGTGSALRPPGPGSYPCRARGGGRPRKRRGPRRRIRAARCQQHQSPAAANAEEAMMGAGQKGLGALSGPAPMLRQERKRRPALIETSIFQRRELKRPRHDQHSRPEYPCIHHQLGQRFD